MEHNKAVDLVNATAKVVLPNVSKPDFKLARCSVRGAAITHKIHLGDSVSVTLEEVEHYKLEGLDSLLKARWNAAMMRMIEILQKMFVGGDEITADKIDASVLGDNTMDFKEAVNAMKQGMKVRRLSWPKEEHIEKFTSDEGEVLVKTKFEDIIRYPYVLLLDDLEAEDWVVV